MAETYCGKSCEACNVRDELGCPGCRVGPGRSIAGDCELASCCRTKGHDSCTTCSFRSSCGTFSCRDSMAERRQRQRKVEAQQNEQKRERAAVLGQWLLVMFWLFIPSTVGSLMTNDTVRQWLPGLYMPGTILVTICAAAYALILLRLGKVHDRYRTAGTCHLISAGVHLVISLITGGDTPGWTLVITLPVFLVALYGTYNEYFGHGEMLEGIDQEQADKWYLLFKWEVGLQIGLIASILLVLILPVLGLIATLAASVGSAVVNVLSLVYLYRICRIFREYLGNCGSGL